MIRPVPGLMLDQQPASALLRMQGCGEARGESNLGMFAVMCTPVNRVGHGRWRAMNLAQVITQDQQYSCFNHTDMNRVKLLEFYKTDPIAWARADALAELIERYRERPLLWTARDITEGATHYVRNDLWGADNAQWYGRKEIAAGRTVQTVVIDHHTFARAA